MDHLIPEPIAAQIRATYVQSVMESRSVFMALQARGQVRELDALAERHADRMVAECEKLVRDHQLGDEINQVGFWSAWDTYLPWKSGEEGAYWLPDRNVRLSDLPAPTLPAKRQAGFAPPPPIPVPSLTRADVDRIVDAAVKAALAKPTESMAEVELTDAEGVVKKSTVKIRRRPA
jgi:hypothetical protein